MLIVNKIVKTAISSSKRKANFDQSISMYLRPKRIMHTALDTIAVIQYFFFFVKKYSVVENENKFLAIYPNRDPKLEPLLLHKIRSRLD